MIDDEKFATLRERAARRGFLTTDDVRQVLPIERMSADEIAMLMLRLEEAGIAVELDADVAGASRRRKPTAPQTPIIDLPGGQPIAHDANRRAPAPGLASDAYAQREPVAQIAPGGSREWTFVAAAGALIAVGALAIFFLSR